MRSPASVLSSILGSTVVACAVTPTHVLDLMDAESDGDIEDAATKASAYLLDRERDVEVRLAAAKTLGRLRHGTPEVIEALGRVLDDPGEDPRLRAFTAWSLGEHRSEPALAALLAALKQPVDAVTGGYLLEGLAKHYALLLRDDDRLVEIVRAMVAFGGNQRRRPPAIYDVLSEATRTVPVNVKVLEKTVDEAREDTSEGRGTRAVYNATYELLDGLERSRGELLAGGASWTTQIEASIHQVQRALDLDDPHTAILALWYLGKLSEIREVASSLASALVGPDGQLAGRPSLSASPARRLVAAWLFSRMQLYGVGPRRALLRDILSREAETAVLEILADVARPSDDQDAIQRILGLERGR